MSEKKICSDVAAVRRLLEAAAPARVVFSNGVFDILHPGHLALLSFAARQGDFLILGVNDDDSVGRLKGPSRPIFPLAERLEILAALEYPDAVVPFSEDTPLRLIRELDCVDVLVKGADYDPEAVVGRREVEARGGRLELFSFQHGYSTSRIITRILEQSGQADQRA